MAQQPLNNLDTNLVQRTKINANDADNASTAAAASAAASAAVAAAGAALTAASAAIPSTQKGAASGVPTLGGDSKVPAAQMTGKLAMADLTDGAALAAAILAAVKTPTGWAASAGGGTPTLTSGTAVLGTAFVNTTTGTTTLSAAIDGITQVAQGDYLICLTAGTYTYVAKGGAYLGVFGSVGALPAAASNTGNFALAGGVFYQSNGTAWAMPGQPASASWATVWDMTAAKDLGEFTLSGALALTSSDAGSIVGGYTTAVLIADGTHVPTFDGNTDSRWINTAGAHNAVEVRRKGNSKFWNVGANAGAAISTPVPAVITTAPVLGITTAGAGVTWTPGTVTGTPTPTVTFSLKKNGTVVASPATSGAYSSTVSGDVLIVTQAATNAAYGGGTATPVDSAPVTVAALPTMTSAAGFGDSIAYGFLAEAPGGRLDPSQRWLDQVCANLGAGTPLNQAISGTVLQDSNDSTGSPRASNGRDRFVSALLGGNKQDGVFLAYGFNDARYTGAPSTFNLTQFGIQFRQVLNGLVMGGYALNKIVCVSPYYITDAGLASGSSGFTGQTRSTFVSFCTEVQNAAKEYGVWYADTYNPMLAGGGASLIDSSDNIHPLATGHTVIAAAVLAAVKQNSVAPATFTPTGGTTSFTYAITAVGSATSYTLEYGIDGTYVFGNTTTVTTSGTISGLAAGTYRVRVRANFSGGTATPWAFSTAITVSGASPAIFLQETFSGSTGTAITSLTPTTGGAWSVQTGYSPSSPNAIDTAGTALYCPSAAGVYQNSATPGSADYYVEAVLNMLSSVGSDNVGIIARADPAANTFYFARYLVGSGWQLFKTVAGTSSQLGATQTDAWTTGTRTVRLTVTGTTIALSVGGTTIVSVTDSAISAAGKAGLRFGAVQGPGAGMHMTSIVAST